MPPAKKHNSIAEALATAQSKMGNAVKNSVNPHFKSTFADFPAVRDIVIPALSAEGIACIQHVDGADGCVTVRTTIHWMETTIEAGNCTIKLDGRNAAQAVGSATTYLKRYQLAAVGGIAQEDDDGQSATNEPSNPTSMARAPSTAQPQKRAPAPTRGTATNVPDCPTCQGPMWDNREQREQQKRDKQEGTRSKAPGPAYKCKDKSCGGVHWEAPSEMGSRIENDGMHADAQQQEERSERGGFDDGLPF